MSQEVENHNEPLADEDNQREENVANEEINAEINAEPENEVVEQQEEDVDELAGRICWVCHSGEQEFPRGAWIAPCRCIGTTKWIHRICFQRYVRSRIQMNPVIPVRCPMCCFIYENDILPIYAETFVLPIPQRVFYVAIQFFRYLQFLLDFVQDAQQDVLQYLPRLQEEFEVLPIQQYIRLDRAAAIPRPSIWSFAACLGLYSLAIVAMGLALVNLQNAQKINN